MGLFDHVLGALHRKPQGPTSSEQILNGSNGETITCQCCSPHWRNSTSEDIVIKIIKSKHSLCLVRR